MTEKNGEKHLVVSPELHLKLKIKASTEGLKLQKLTEDLLNKSLEE